MKFLRAMLPIGLAAATLLSSGTALASATDASAFVSKINAERRAAGLKALIVKSDLAAVARSHSAEMAEAGTIYHNGSLMRQVRGWREIGENVGMGPDVDTLHEAFMRSESHRANIERATYNEVGIGVVIADDGTMFVTEVFARRGAATTVRSASSGTQARRVAPAPKPRPASPPKHATAEQPNRAPAAARAIAAPPVRTVRLLVQMMGLDAD